MIEVTVDKYFNYLAYFTLRAGMQTQFCFSPFSFSILKEAAEWDSCKSDPVITVVSNTTQTLILVGLLPDPVHY